MEGCLGRKNSKCTGSGAGTNMRSRGTVWQPLGLEWKERKKSEVGRNVGGGYDRGF